MNTLGKTIPSEDAERYLYLKQVLHYLNSFSDSVEAETGHMLCGDKSFPHEHVDSIMNKLERSPTCISANVDSFHEYAFMHRPLFLMPFNASTDPSPEEAYEEALINISNPESNICQSW